VDGLRALVALLGVVGDLCALLQRAVALAVDAGVMDEQVLLAIVGGDETEPLVVAEPLHCAGRHIWSSSTCVLLSCVPLRGGCFSELRPALALPFHRPICAAGRPDRSRSSHLCVYNLLFIYSMSVALTRLLPPGDPAEALEIAIGLGLHERR